MEKQNELEATTTTKKTYQKPNLVRYGAIQQITKGGNTDRPEGSGQGNRDKMP
jgi:hypothetical protein